VFLVGMDQLRNMGSGQALVVDTVGRILERKYACAPPRSICCPICTCMLTAFASCTCPCSIHWSQRSILGTLPGRIGACAGVLGRSGSTAQYGERASSCGRHCGPHSGTQICVNSSTLDLLPDLCSLGSLLCYMHVHVVLSPLVLDPTPPLDVDLYKHVLHRRVGTKEKGAKPKESTVAPANIRAIGRIVRCASPCVMDLFTPTIL
jgi:hypothetical protein